MNLYNKYINISMEVKIDEKKEINQELEINNIIFFWKEYSNFELNFNKLVDKNKYNIANQYLNNLSNKIKLDVNFYINKNKRNFLELEERNNYYEIIISPNLNYNNINIIV